MTKRYCDRCGQQIDEGVHAWYVLELHGTDGEFRHKELCEECYELLAEDNYIPRIEQTEPQVIMPKKCTSCDSASKIIEAYSRGFEDGAEAVKAMPQTFTADGTVFAKMTEAEQTEPQTIRCPKCGRSDYIREFGKDFSVTAEEAGFKYKCINCNTYIEPQSDRKTENSSEKPNNCDTCKYGQDKHRYAHICNECGVGINNYEPKDEPQTELVNDSLILVKDLVDDEFNPYDEECMRCKHLKLKCEFIPTYCKFEPKDEPQRDCLTCRYNSDEWDSPKCDGCSKAHSNYEPQTDCAWK